jgi:hypothetical protein
MNPRLRQLLFWAPRALSILFAVFLSLFAFDVFGEGYAFWETLWALLLHLVPSALVLVVLSVAWRWEWIGGLLFFGLGLLYIAISRGRMDWMTYLLLVGPLWLAGALFLIGWRFRSEIRVSP